MTFFLQTIPIAFIIFGVWIIGLLRERFFDDISGPNRWLIELAGFVILVTLSVNFFPLSAETPFTVTAVGLLWSASATYLLSKLFERKEGSDDSR